MSLVKSSATISFYTMISRLFGYAREVFVAAALGVSPLADAFVVAFRIPNFMRRVFAEGAFTAAFLPIFSGILVTDGEPTARKFAEESLALLMTVLIGLVAVMEIAMPWIMLAFAPGFDSGSDKFALAVTLTRITLPYILFISVASLFGAMLNSMQRFAAFASAPIIMNASLVASAWALDPLSPSSAHALAIGVTISGVAQVVWLMWFCRKAGLLPRLRRPRLTPHVKKLLILIGPAALGAGVAQINLMVDTIIGSHMPEAISALYFADRLSQLPLGVIGVAIGTALLPMLARQFRAGQHAEAIESQNRALELAMLFTLPAALAMFLLAEPMLRVLFERGAFDASATAATRGALMALSLGLPAFIAVKIFTPGFFANEDTSTPVKIAFFCMALNVAMSLSLMDHFRQVALAMATATSGWANALLLGIMLYRRGLYRVDERLKRKMAGVLFACMAMGLVLIVGEARLAEWLVHPKLKYLGLTVLIAAGGGVFVGMAVLTRAADWREIKGYLRRKPKIPLPVEET